MKLAYVTTYDARDRSKWSGLGFYMARALASQGVEIEYIGPLQVDRQWYLRVKKQIYRRLLRKRFLVDREVSVVNGFARQAAAQVAALDVDVVFSPGTIPIASLQTDRPIAFWTDSTFAGMIDFYPDFTNLAPDNILHGNALEAAALRRAALAIYSSDWAAQTAIHAYGIDQAKVHVVPFGANIDASPSFESVRPTIDTRSRSVCRLLFLGVAWFRKGGDIAVEVARELNRAGLPTELLVVGSKPRVRGRLPSFVRYCGSISKSSPDRLSQLQALMARTHFLLLPTRADCTPVVFSEANAFGVPCLSTRVGGIPTIIRDGVNGSTFAVDAPVSAYCDYIADAFGNPQRYRDLALSSFQEHNTRLNWSTAGRRVRELLASLKPVQ